MTAPTLPRPQIAVGTCAACGHRLSLHGQYLRETWCIAWDGNHFCGCQTYAAARKP